jgi:hypothetical protein
MVPEIQGQLESAGHEVTFPNSIDNPTKEFEMKEIGSKEHSSWKGRMLRLGGEKVLANDAILVLNMDKNGVQNYIGGATFIEMYQAFDAGKKIFLYNNIPDGMLRDEILAFEPVVINKDLLRI